MPTKQQITDVLLVEVKEDFLPYPYHVYFELVEYRIGVIFHRCKMSQFDLRFTFAEK